ncbi:MAG TPA: ComF family protein [Acidobacteriota bacterium]|nr:ComF family protein [Acidobacteriota bacterium]
MRASVVKARAWLDAAIDFAFPPLCLGCGEFVPEGVSVCRRCLQRIDRFEYPICLTCSNAVERGSRCTLCGADSLLLFAYGNYVDPLKQIVVQFKFRGIRTPARLFASLLAEKYSERIQSLGADLLVPIPLHMSREYHRGYNQALLLAKELECRLHVTCDDGRIFRVRKRRPQTRLRKTDRASNIRGVFRAVPSGGQGRRVILVDDVVTSGATVREARNELSQAGCTVVAVIAIGHGL